MRESYATEDLVYEKLGDYVTENNFSIVQKKIKTLAPKQDLDAAMNKQTKIMNNITAEFD